jgi:hypothetical protein
MRTKISIALCALFIATAAFIGCQKEDQAVNIMPVSQPAALCSSSWSCNGSSISGLGEPNYTINLNCCFCLNSSFGSTVTTSGFCSPFAVTTTPVFNNTGDSCWCNAVSGVTMNVYDSQLNNIISEPLDSNGHINTSLFIDLEEADNYKVVFSKSEKHDVVMESVHLPLAEGETMNPWMD